MIPILYQTITEGSVPTHYGLGVLTDCLSCEVSEERNGAYELTLSYAAQGIHAADIQLNRFIMAKPNFTDDPQIFRIYKIGKTMNGRFEVSAQHISYDLSGKVITSGTANNIATACALLMAQAGGFTIDTTKTTVANFAITEPSSVRSWFGGKQGSLLDVYGTGEWKYDNFHCRLMTSRGADRGMQIRYGKNLTDLNQDLNCSNLYTHVVSYWKDETTVVMGNQVATGLSLDTNKVLVYDASSDFEEAPTSADLDAFTSTYISSHNLTAPTNNITLNFQQSGTLVERVDLCDTVTVYFEALDITAKFKCIRTKWDVLAERYIENEFGDPRGSITDTIVSENAAITQTSNIAQQAIRIAETSITSVDVEYAMNQSSTTAPTTGWSTTPPTWQEGYYIWTRTKTTASSGVSYSTPFCISSSTEGPAGVGISSIVEQYYLSTSDQTPTGGSWSNTQPAWESGKYIWTRSFITWTDSTTSYTTPILASAINSANELANSKRRVFTTTPIPPYDNGDLWINEEKILYCITPKSAGQAYSEDDWTAIDTVDSVTLEDAIAHATAWITGGNGGYVIIHRDAEGRPYELLISDSENITANTARIWRWNINGLGYSSTGYDGTFIPAITSDGRIVADFISTGVLDANNIEVRNLNATMFTGAMIQLGGYQNQDGTLVLKNSQNNIIAVLDTNGMECFGEPVNGVTPSVVFDKNGVTGYSDKDNKSTSAIFWTHADEFHMKNSVVENEASFGSEIRFVPLDNGTNKGTAIVKVV
jgi:phage minor structural protein